MLQHTNRTLTLQLSRAELENISRAIGIASYMLAAARGEKAIQVTDEEQQTAKVFLPKVHRLSYSLARILIEQGWIDDDGEEDEES